MEYIHQNLDSSFGMITQRAFDDYRFQALSHRQTDRDSWELMAMARKDIPLQIVTAHVKSNQDDKIPYDLLPYEAQMNVAMDRRADEVREGTSPIPPVPEFEGQDFQIKIHGQIIYSNVGATLRRVITGKAMKAYMKTKYAWTDVTISKVDCIYKASPNKLERMSSNYDMDGNTQENERTFSNPVARKILN